MTEHADRRTEHAQPGSDAGPSSEDDLAEAAHQDLIDEVRALRTRVNELEEQNSEYRKRIEAENADLRERLEKMRSAMDDEAVEKALAHAIHLQEADPEDVNPDLLPIAGELLENYLKMQRNQDRIIDELQAQRESR